jgi:hypothetical protein
VALNGVRAEGFRTIVFPDASAGATLCATIFNGALNEVIPQTTPRGTRIVNAIRCACPGAASIGTISPVSRFASSAAMMKVWTVRPTSIVASAIGIPPSAVISAASAARCWSISVAAFISTA